MFWRNRARRVSRVPQMENAVSWHVCVLPVERQGCNLLLNACPRTRVQVHRFLLQRIQYAVLPRAQWSLLPNTSGWRSNTPVILPLHVDHRRGLVCTGRLDAA